jgi:hypothetical protein
MFSWITFCIEVFALLVRRPTVTLVNTPDFHALPHPAAGHYYVLECFPTSTWRTAALPTLPGKSRCTPATITAHATALRDRFNLPEFTTQDHDDLQAIVAALPAAGLLGAPCQAIARGVPGQPCSPNINQPTHWVEGLIWDAIPNDRTADQAPEQERPARQRSRDETELTEETTMLDRISALLGSATGDAPRIRPTALYNEGWMLRLLLDWAAVHARPGTPLYFQPHASWFSEGLLPSPFLARSRGDALAESWTNADGAIGHFRVGPLPVPGQQQNAQKAALILDARASQLVVIEAKMFSRLSPDIKSVRTYNQAARTVACIAEVLRRSSREPKLMTRLTFYVVAPEEQIKRGVFGRLLDHDNLIANVRLRVDMYRGEKDAWFHESFMPAIDALKVTLIDWESLISSAGAPYHDFYRRCLDFNRPARPLTD